MGLFDGAELISAYTRAQAILDGVLVPVTDLTPDEPDFARQAGFQVHVALTSAAAGIIIPNEEEQSYGQDVKGRLWDALNMGRMFRPTTGEGEQKRGATTWLYDCIFYLAGRDEGDLIGRPTLDLGERHRLVQLKCVIGPDDDGQACVTIMLPGES